MAIIEKAPAKINLGLDICGKREDGFHELSMIMVSVDLNDYVTVSELEEDVIHITSNSVKMPLDEKNDIYKATMLLKETYGIRKGVAIDLDKHIPVCAGLGGGSSDAAATLRALNQLWDLQLTYEELAKIGFEVGSDVPYCLSAGCAKITGKGEIVEVLPAHLSGWVVLVKPDFGVSTRTIFREINPDDISRVDIAGIEQALYDKDYQALLAHMGNSLEDITIAKHPLIQKIKNRLMKGGADIALMTGSGPTVFALCPSEKRADRLVNSMKGFCKEVYKVRLLA